LLAVNYQFAGDRHPFTGCKHRQGEGLYGPVQGRRECGTLYDRPSKGATLCRGFCRLGLLVFIC
jgi:hypothetical protein